MTLRSPGATPNMKLTRRQHIVSRMWLANFTDHAGLLWIYAKGNPPRPSKPENECHQRDFYEYELNARKTNNKYENWLSRVEGNAVPIFHMLASRQRLDEREAVIWSTFVASAFLRTRKVRSQISSLMGDQFKVKSQDPLFIREMQYDLFCRGQLVSANEIRNDVDRLRAAMDASPSFYHVVGLPDRLKSLADAIMRKHWFTVEAPAGKSFLISDCPVTTGETDGRKVSPGVGFGKPNGIVVVPLSSDNVFVASPPNLGWRVVATPAGVDNINRLIVQFAERNVYAGGRFPEIQSLVDTELNQVVFGKNAFLPPNGTAS